MQAWKSQSRRRKTCTMDCRTARGTPSQTKNWALSPMPRAEMGLSLGASLQGR